MPEANGTADAPPPAPTLFLGMPGYGDLTAGAAKGYWRATALPDDRVYRQYNEGSLLAANFNALWCAALNLAAAGLAPRYFAMQHADVEPEDGWADALAAELDARGLDVLGVAVPIKSPEGLTSLALARPDGDPWRPLCRLTLDEVHRLPETFTSEDLGAPLLLNTGLWICRFDERWARQVHFTINDRIVRTPDGRFASQVEPEDWYFSRLLHELGLKVGATRKIKLLHRGPAAFANAAPWGRPFDRDYVAASVLPESGSESISPAFALPDDIPGWLRADEGAMLARLALSKRVLEIGSYMGLSTVCLARTAEHVTAVDYFDGRGTPRPGRTLGTFEDALARHKVAGKVTARFPGEPLPFDAYDLAYIDGAHDARSVRLDIGRARAALAPGGLLAFHDYRSPDDPGVAEAVDELLASGGELLSLTGTLAVVRPPSPSAVLDLELVTATPTQEP